MVAGGKWPSAWERERTCRQKDEVYGGRIMRKSPRRDVPLRCPQSLGHLGALCALPSGRSGDHANSIGNQCEAGANPGANSPPPPGAWRKKDVPDRTGCPERCCHWRQVEATTCTRPWRLARREELHRTRLIWPADQPETEANQTRCNALTGFVFKLSPILSILSL